MLGYSFKRARLSIKYLRNEEQFDKQQFEIIELIELHKQGYLDLYFGDESHFGLTPNLPYAWQHKNKPLLLPAARSKSLSVLGLMTPCCKLYSKTFEQTINSDIAIEFMDDFANQIVKKTVVILDNAPIHKSKKFIANIARWREQDLYIYFLPPYSPELNKIEILWRFIKYQWIPLDAYRNFQNLKDRLNETLLLVGSKHIIKYY